MKASVAGRTAGPARAALACALACLLVVGMVPATAFADYPSPNPQPMPKLGDQVVHGKFGDNAMYTVVSNSSGGVQGTAALGNGTSPAFPAEATGTVIIPKDVYIVYDWEGACTYEVTSIKAHAFDYSGGTCPFDKVIIEGDVALEPDALVGLPDTVSFVACSATMAQTLVDAGVPAERVKHNPVRTRYVAFGDSISAGFALPEYDSSILTYDGRMTPSDAFPTLTGLALNEQYGIAVTDNQSTSGWTSKQLLDQLNRGDYGAALETADVVSVTIGSNDLLGRFIEIVQQSLVEVFNQASNESGDPGLRVKSFDELTPERIEALEAQAEALAAQEAGGEASAQGKTKLIPDLVDTLNANIVNDPELLAACETFRTVNQPAIVAKLRELAPTADIYWTTMYNPFYGVVLDLKELFPALKALYPRRDLVVDLSTAGASYIELMNKTFENPTGYHPVDLYEPFNKSGLTNVLIGRDPVTNKLLFGVDPHPNHDGHQLIADLLTKRIMETFTPNPVAPIWPGPDEPKPIKPETPDTKPVVPDANDAGQKKTSTASDESTSAKSLVRTGDPTPYVPFAALLAASAAAVAFAWRRRNSTRSRS